MRLAYTSLEKVHSYAAWLARLLPNWEVLPEVEITEKYVACRPSTSSGKRGSASVSPGDKEALKAIGSFGAKLYKEDEQKELSEIVEAFSERHGTDATRRT